jgi:hypothetical protein
VIALRAMNVEGTPLFGWLPQDGGNELGRS